MDELVVSPAFFHGHLDENNPLSLYTKMGQKWGERFKKSALEIPTLIDYIADEHELARRLKGMGFKANAVDNRYRFQLWLEYENSVREKRLMKMSNVYSLVGPPATFYSNVMGNPLRVCWMLCRPHDYAVQAREMLAAGMTQMRRVLDEDPFEGDKPNMKLIELQLKITQMMDLRLHGAPTQKIQSAHIHAQLSAAGELEDASKVMNAEAYRHSIEMLKKRKLAAQGRGPEASAEGAIEVEVVVEGQPKSD